LVRSIGYLLRCQLTSVPSDTDCYLKCQIPVEITGRYITRKKRLLKILTTIQRCAVSRIEDCEQKESNIVLHQHIDLRHE
jgi:hypothetical protein